MKLLQATAYFDSHRGGIEIVASRLARELVALGLPVTWLACDATAPAADASSEAGIGCRAVAISAWNITERRLGVPLPLPGLAGIATILREVKAADAVMLHDSLYPPTWSPCWPRAGTASRSFSCSTLQSCPTIIPFCAV